MKLLRKYIRETLLSEAAKGISDMKNKKIYYTASGSEIQAWLCSARQVDWARKNNPNLGYDSIMNRASVGIISAVKDMSGGLPCSDAYIITWSHVDNEASGFGPMLYDVLMELATKWGPGVAADRSNVSDDAFNVWDYYHKNRSDVTKIQLDDEKGRLTPEDSDDCFQDAAYQGGDGRYGWWEPGDEDNPWDPDGEQVLRDSPISKVYKSKGTPTLDALESAGKLVDIAQAFFGDYDGA